MAHTTSLPTKYCGSTQAYVYVMACPIARNVVKIGVSRDLPQRVNSVSRHYSKVVRNHHTFFVAATIGPYHVDKAREIEHAMHVYFSDSQIVGDEWSFIGKEYFNISLNKAVSALNSGANGADGKWKIKG